MKLENVSKISKKGGGIAQSPISLSELNFGNSS